MAGIEHPIARQEIVADFPADISDTARALFLAPTLTDTLQRLVDLAVATIDGCDYAGVFLGRGSTLTTGAHTDPAVNEIDEMQSRSREGPCFEAAAAGHTVYAEDLVDETRWPTFTAEATARGLRSALSFCLTSDGTVGALNLYARYPRAFGVIDRAKGLILAALAGLAIGSAQAHEDEERRAGNLHAALATREVIGQAQGILMERERIRADEAFDILRRASQHLNRKLREVAQDLVDTGEPPPTQPAAGSKAASRQGPTTGSGRVASELPAPEFASYDREHLAAIIAICESEGWTSFPDDPDRAHRVLTAPGVTSVVALCDDEVVGFAYVQSDGEIQAHLSNIGVRTTHRRRGIGRGLLAAGLQRAGGERVDLVTDTAAEFYEALGSRRLAGYRVYPFKPSAGADPPVGGDPTDG
jgi:ribosomal protein S18 acetylase RimI-like enzyme